MSISTIFLLMAVTVPSTFWPLFKAPGKPEAPSISLSMTDKPPTFLITSDFCELFIYHKFLSCLLDLPILSCFSLEIVTSAQILTPHNIYDRIPYTFEPNLGTFITQSLCSYLSFPLLPKTCSSCSWSCPQF